MWSGRLERPGARRCIARVGSIVADAMTGAEDATQFRCGIGQQLERVSQLGRRLGRVVAAFGMRDVPEDRNHASERKGADDTGGYPLYRTGADRRVVELRDIHAPVLFAHQQYAEYESAAHERRHGKTLRGGVPPKPSRRACTTDAVIANGVALHRSVRELEGVRRRWILLLEYRRLAWSA